ncbi:Hypothetical predicted protein, partial [Mytilus galloprovincialis]
MLSYIDEEDNLGNIIDDLLDFYQLLNSSPSINRSKSDLKFQREATSAGWKQSKKITGPVDEMQFRSTTAFGFRRMSLRLSLKGHTFKKSKIIIILVYLQFGTYIQNVAEYRCSWDTLRYYQSMSSLIHNIFTFENACIKPTFGETPECEWDICFSLPASNIGHLIRRKRKPDEDEEKEPDTKKTKQDGAGDATVNGTNGVMEVDKKKVTIIVQS